MMIVHSITIDHVRGVQHLELRDIPTTGVVVITGENETGKSTILDALHAVLYLRHSSKSQLVRGMQPVGEDVGPRIRLQATIGPYSFDIEKQYLKKKHSKLLISAPQTERYTGLEADQKLEAIIAEYLDEDLFDALLMRQGDIDTGMRAVGIPSLVAALESERQPEASDDSALMQRVDAEYARYFTLKTETPTGELKAATTQFEDAKLALTSAQTALQELEQFVRRHEVATEELHDTMARRPSAEMELTQAQQRHEKARAAQAVIDREAAQLDTAQAQLRLAEAQAAIYDKQTAHIAQLEEQLDILVANSQQLQQEAEAAAEVKNQAHEQYQQGLDAVRAAHEALHAAEQQQRQADDALVLIAAKTRAEQWEKAEAEHARLSATQPERYITMADVQAVEELDFALRTARLEQAAAAAKVVLHASQDTDIEVNGSPLTVTSTEHEIEVTGETTLRIGEVAAVVYAGREGESAKIAVAEAQRALQAQLQVLGVKDLAEARSRQREHQHLQDTLRQSQRSLAQFRADGQTLSELHAQIARLAHIDLDTALPLEDAKAAVAAATTIKVAAEREVEILRGKLDGVIESSAYTKYQVHLARVHNLEQALEQAQQDYALLEKEQPRQQVQQHVAEARTLCTQVEQRLRAARATEYDVTVTAQVLAGATAQLKHIDENIVAAEKTLAELSGRITQAEGAAEYCEQAEVKLQQAKSQLMAVTRRADAAQTLRSALLRHRDIARQKYAKPFLDALTHLAKPIFGNDVSFVLTDELQIQQREVKNIPLNIQALSGGAQEQLAILTRLAIAQLVAKDGVPIFIDDALGSSDSARIALLSALLGDLGRQHQVFILTCDRNRYLRIGDATRLQMDELKTVDSQSLH